MHTPWATKERDGGGGGDCVQRRAGVTARHHPGEQLGLRGWIAIAEILTSAAGHCLVLLSPCGFGGGVGQGLQTAKGAG